eukprot:11183070-Lingulodinium_polyedra.AAC.1
MGPRPVAKPQPLQRQTQTRTADRRRQRRAKLRTKKADAARRGVAATGPGQRAQLAWPRRACPRARVLNAAGPACCPQTRRRPR